ncbi:hypothetical protein [Amycolatopsis plumensis]|uniref:Uncharacterized protein n=1 Tax=Amycolatopsis plumensis TaxID=236508 RepID=A0ABV5UCN1_9PSEU
MRVSRARGWVDALVVGWLVCLALDLALSFAPVPVWVALGLAGPVRLPWWDLPARAVATAVLVLALTART